MSTVLTHSSHLINSTATEAFGEHLGRNLLGGEVIELISDLGGGKTTLTRGIARGAGSSDVVGSPTFMISKLYKAVICDIYHYDLYRLSQLGLMENELQEILEDKRNVLILEWGESSRHILPPSRLIIHIKKTKDDSREIICDYPDELAYLLESR